jgi:TIR domain
MSGLIFISYRREESRWSARSLYDRLSASFGPKQIFMDIDAIALGEDFIKAIERTVSECDVLIAVIGASWLTSKDDQGDRRLNNPEDFVRMEIATALSRDIRVIPVLVDGALMPRPTELPDDLKPLVRRNALRISDTSFDGDCQRLVAAIKQVLETERLEKERPKAEQQDRERLKHPPQSQPPAPVAPFAPSIPSAKPEADKSAETPKVVPLAPKPAESEREKLPSSSSGGTGGKSPSKQVIAFLAIAAVLAVGGLIYLAIRASQSPPHQPASVAAVTPSPPVTATPTKEELAPPTPEAAVQPSAKPTAPASASPSLTVPPSLPAWANWSVVPGGRTTDRAPAAATDFSGNLHLLVKGIGDSRIYINNMWGVTREWTGWEEVPPGGLTTNHALAAAMLDRVLYAFAVRDDGAIMYKHLYEGSGPLLNNPWTEVPGGARTDAAVAATTANGRLVLSGKGIQDQQIYLNELAPGGRSWSGWYVVPGGRRTDAGPGLAAFQDKLYVLIKEPASGHILTKVRTPDGDWSDWTQIPGGGVTDVSIAAVSASEELYLFIKGVNDRAPYWNVASDTGTWSLWQAIPNGGTTDEAYAATSIGGRLYLFGKGIDDHQLYMRYTFKSAKG